MPRPFLTTVCCTRQARAGGERGTKAEHLRPGRHAALKFLPESLATHAHAMERFDREARAASSLDHPNIRTSYEIARRHQPSRPHCRRPLRLDLLSSNLRRSRCNFIP
jgi:hypothetical protein